MPKQRRFRDVVDPLRDEDDACPKALAPKVASMLRTLALPFPAAYVLLHPEYEVLFLPCMDLMMKFGYPPATAWRHESWEAVRGVKEWLSKQLPPGRAYKPTVDQYDMTRQLDFARLRTADVPCFGTLERALWFFADHLDCRVVVYPSEDLQGL